LRQGGKGRSAGGTLGKKAKVKSVKDSAKEGALARRDDEDDPRFGTNCYALF